jgi:hypothetical protein
MGFAVRKKLQRDRGRNGVSRSAVTNSIPNKDMKTMNTLLLASAVALGFTLTTTAKADEPFLSPRAKANQTSRVSGVDTSPNLVSHNYLGAASKMEFNRVRVVAPGSPTPNLVSGNYLGAALKNPYPRTTSFEVAPLTGKDRSGKTCEANCTMPCCAKK